MPMPAALVPAAAAAPMARVAAATSAATVARVPAAAAASVARVPTASAAAMVATASAAAAVVTLNTGLSLFLLGLSLFSCGHEESRSKQDSKHNETLGRHA